VIFIDFFIFFEFKFKFEFWGGSTAGYRYRTPAVTAVYRAVPSGKKNPASVEGPVAGSPHCRSGRPGGVATHLQCCPARAREGEQEREGRAQNHERPEAVPPPDAVLPELARKRGRERVFYLQPIIKNSLYLQPTKTKFPNIIHENFLCPHTTMSPSVTI
jgi:hypothetical protein